MALTPEMEAALQQYGVTPFLAIRITLPTYTIRILDGAATLVIAGETFTGSDPTYGTLASVDSTASGIVSEAPNMRIVMNPPTNTAAADLADPLVQGSPVSLLIGLVNPLTGIVVPSPMTEFYGELDLPILHVDHGSRQLEYEIVSVFERMFEIGEGVAFSNSFHKSIYPGEDGLQYVTGVGIQIPWGADSPRPNITNIMPGNTLPAGNTIQDAVRGFFF